jgi:hypothetical protein
MNNVGTTSARDKRRETVQIKQYKMKDVLADLIKAKYGDRVVIELVNNPTSHRHGKPNGAYIVDGDIRVSVSADQFGDTDTIICQLGYGGKFRETKKDGIPYDHLMESFETAITKIASQRKRDNENGENKAKMVEAIKASGVELYDFGEGAVKLESGDVRIHQDGRVSISYHNDNPEKVIAALKFLQGLKG